MSARICCHCGKPIVQDPTPAGWRWEASQSSRVVIDGKPSRVVHEHLACAIKADQPLSRDAYEAIFEAERSGVA